MRKIPETNTTAYLCTSYGYSKKQLTNSDLIKKMLIKEIESACKLQGYRLTEIKIEKI